MKTRTTSKHSLRVGVLSLLLVLPIALSGCGKSTKALKVGDFNPPSYPRSSHPMAITADTDTFPIDNVVVNLHFALYNTDSCEAPGVNPLLSRRFDLKRNESLFLVLYFSDTAASFPKIDGDFDYVNVPNYHYIKEYPHEVVTTEALGYTVNKKFFSKTISYEHSEKLSIPEELFSSDQKSSDFEIYMLFCQVTVERNRPKYLQIGGNHIKIKYELQEDGTVRLFKPY